MSRKFCFAGRPVRRAAGGAASLIPVTEGIWGHLCKTPLPAVPLVLPRPSRPLPKGRWQVQKQGFWCSPQVRNPKSPRSTPQPEAALWIWGTLGLLGTKGSSCRHGDYSGFLFIMHTENTLSI